MVVTYIESGYDSGMGFAHNLVHDFGLAGSFSWFIRVYFFTCESWCTCSLHGQTLHLSHFICVVIEICIEILTG